MKKKKKNLEKTLILLSIILIVMYFFYIYEKFIKEEDVMLYVPTYNQYPNYPNGCESAALYMLLKSYNTDITMEDIVNKLPKEPIPYEKNGTKYGGNPERGYVGDPRKYNGYGVYNEPLKDVADYFKKGALTKSNATLKDIKKILKDGNPVIAWYTIKPSEDMLYFGEWIDYKTNEIIKYPKYLHAVVITGYDSKGNLFYNDSYTGTSAGIGEDLFEKNFKELGSRILYYNNN